MLNTSISLSRSLLVALLIGGILSVAGCSQQNASNTKPDDYKQAPPAPPTAPK